MSDCIGGLDDNGYPCAASVHVHGCFSDVPPAVCDEPSEHVPAVVVSEEGAE